ncbi:TIGR03960 family B12-binding radical SAM protein [Citroniella saccharovorans]|uniref:TIGR03960 family B12-binding radical SAM protein n=2 Tax=Citroniella saccharovorans TaxID=2053367 RepID=A0AAW9MZB5_9FIRM|nr:TIGR03960 family B12-binding radical SAM protein [Citroniella saccharovorans]
MILNRVEKPSRYIGNEINTILKDDSNERVSMAFLFPDVYEVGMSYNGLNLFYNLINDKEEFSFERAFSPWVDMEEEMRKNDLPLFTLESKRAVKEFDIVGFTLQYEMSYTNILNMLELSGISIKSIDRKEEEPLVIAGGPCAFNPEPLADFIDLFYIGEAEEGILEILKLYQNKKDNNLTKDDFLKMAAENIEGVYVPKFYEITYKKDETIDKRIKLYDKAKDIIKKRYIENVNDVYVSTKPIVPNTESVHDRVVTEIFKGCTRGCRFCQAGMIYRPIREKSTATILDIIDSNLKNSGYDEVSLSSLSTCDYTELQELVKELLKKYEKENVSISLPSLRLDSDSLSVLKDIEKVRKTGLTFAPEAGSQRLRDVINKNITDEDIERAVSYAFKEGYSTIKLYFMLGLPTETMEDVQGIKEIAYYIKEKFFNRDKEDIKGNLKITVSTSLFVPKPFTPFQWDPQDDLENLYEKVKFLKDIIRDKKINYNYHEPRLSYLEAVVSRGDRRVGELIYRAFKNGAKFDSWKDQFKFDAWTSAAEELGLNMDFYAKRKRDFDEILPWDFIDIGVSKKFLIKEKKLSNKEITTKDCREGCIYCGVSEGYKGDYCPCM